MSEPPATASPASKPVAAAVPAVATPASPETGNIGKTAADVLVVPGIARYHLADCILIRFLGDDDLETMTRPAAEAAGCMPCKACKPESH